jgi:hypothetical protein
MDSVFRNVMAVENGIYSAIFETVSRSMRYVDLSSYQSPHFSGTNIPMQPAYVRHESKSTKP